MNISTTVAAQGKAEAPHNLAHFHVVLASDANSVPIAKHHLKKQVDELMASLDAMKQKLGLEFVKNSLHKTSSVNEHYQYNQKKSQQEFVGYQATYSVTFTIDDLDKVSQVYDTLTNMKEIKVPQPWFSLKNMERLNKKALKKAWENVQARFEEECAVLGLDHTEFEVGTWETNYSDSRRSDRVATATRGLVGAAAPAAFAASLEMVEGSPLGGAPEEDTILEIDPGNATVTVNLEVGYIRRANAQPNPSVKATLVSVPHDSVAVVNRARKESVDSAE